jgi:hypothetical protein
VASRRDGKRRCDLTASSPSKTLCAGRAEMDEGRSKTCRSGHSHIGMHLVVASEQLISRVAALSPATA